MNAIQLLVLLIVAAMGVSYFAAGLVRSAAADLDAETRSRLDRAFAKTEFVWDGIDWLCIAAILVAFFTKTFGNRWQTTALGAVALICLTGMVQAWHRSIVYKREAAASSASKSARNAALLVSLAELALVAFIVSRINFSKLVPSLASPKSDDTELEVKKGDEDSKGLWIPEAEARKQLDWLKKDEFDEYVEREFLKKKSVAGKTLIHDVEIQKLKKQHAADSKLPD